MRGGHRGGGAGGLGEERRGEERREGGGRGTTSQDGGGTGAGGGGGVHPGIHDHPKRTKVAVCSQLPLWKRWYPTRQRTTVPTNKKKRLENCASPVSPGWKLDRKVEEGMVCGGEEGEGTGPNHRPTGMLRDRRVFIFKRPDIIIVIIIIVRELITPFRSKNYGHCLFPFFFSSSESI